MILQLLLSLVSTLSLVTFAYAFMSLSEVTLPTLSLYLPHHCSPVKLNCHNFEVGVRGEEERVDSQTLVHNVKLLLTAVVPMTMSSVRESPDLSI